MDINEFLTRAETSTALVIIAFVLTLYVFNKIDHMSKKGTK